MSSVTQCFCRERLSLVLGYSAWGLLDMCHFWWGSPFPGVIHMRHSWNAGGPLIDVLSLDLFPQWSDLDFFSVDIVVLWPHTFCGCTCICVHSMWRPEVSLRHCSIESSSLILRQGLWLGTGAHWLGWMAVWQTPGIHLSISPVPGFTIVCPYTHSAFYVGSGKWFRSSLLAW